jgi:hypothetical protein
LSEIEHLNKGVKLYYLTLFGIKEGIEEVRKKTVFKNNLQNLINEIMPNTLTFI